MFASASAVQQFHYLVHNFSAYPLTEIPAVAFLMLNRDGMDWNYKTTPQKKACFAMPKQVPTTDRN
jgi:hypothetical protein